MFSQVKSTHCDGRPLPAIGAALVAACLHLIALAASASAQDQPVQDQPVQDPPGQDPPGQTQQEQDQQAPDLPALGPGERLPFRRSAIDYFSDSGDDPLGRLKKRLEAGAARLEYDDQHGYLRSVLKALDVPVESQTLVFSKSSLNTRLIGPATPRAIYFNDQAYVGWTPGAPSLEITSVDARKGALFYTLPQQAEAVAFRREERCLLCHASSSALGAPGHLVRSFVTNEEGRLVSGYSRVTHDTPFRNRWAGWYVTGQTGELPHQGNLVSEADHDRRRREGDFATNVKRLDGFFDVDRYLTPHSDVVALLALDHQAHMNNLLTRLGFETRLGYSSDIVRRLARYMLFLDAAALTNPVRGSTAYTEWFQRQGRRDCRGRSLRDLDLKTRLLKYRLSYLIYAPAFDGLPEAAKRKVYRALRDGLTGAPGAIDCTLIPKSERQAILEILRSTKGDFREFEKGASHTDDAP